jgi:pimeloyl-ACP methyl ester carboxylesterase
LWFVHGFADSGLAFREILESNLADEFGLYAPDLPGFGASPAHDGIRTIDQFTEAVIGLIETLSPNRPIGLIGHSVGAIIAVEAAHRLGGRCCGLVSIEGNMTADDAYFSGRAPEFDDPSAFKARLSELVWKRSLDDPVLRRYHASVLMAAAPTMWSFGRDVGRYSVGDHAGHRYRALPAPTLYCWSPSTAPEATLRFVETHHVANREFAGAGHWPMLDATEEVVAALRDFFSGEG